MSGGYGNTVGTRLQQQAGLGNLQPKQAWGVASGGGRALGGVWESGVGWDTHGGDSVVSRIPGRVVTRRPGEPRMGQDIVHGQAAGGVTTQQGIDEVAGTGADPLWHLELPTPNLGKE